MEELKTTLTLAWQDLLQALHSGEPPLYVQLLVLTGIFIVVKGTMLLLARVGASRKRAFDYVTVAYVILVIGALAGGWDVIVDHFSHVGENGDNWIS